MIISKISDMKASGKLGIKYTVLITMSTVVLLPRASLGKSSTFGFRYWYTFEK